MRIELMEGQIIMWQWQWQWQWMRFSKLEGKTDREHVTVTAYRTDGRRYFRLYVLGTALVHCGGCNEPLLCRVTRLGGTIRDTVVRQVLDLNQLMLSG